MGRRKGTTTFPIARIKKIMQQDDDVGKIATNTPALVGKALECLMEDLLRDSAAIALERRAKTLTPSHLKASVGSRAQFDFLRPVLANVPDVTENCDAGGSSSRSKRPRSVSVPSLNTNAPPNIVKRRKPAASPVAVAAAAQQYQHDLTSVPVVVPERVDRKNDDDEDDYDEDEPMPPVNIELSSVSSPIASSYEMPDTPVVIRDFGLTRPAVQRKDNNDEKKPAPQTSSRARVSVHALLS